MQINYFLKFLLFCHTFNIKKYQNVYLDTCTINIDTFIITPIYRIESIQCNKYFLQLHQKKKKKLTLGALELLQLRLIFVRKKLIDTKGINLRNIFKNFFEEKETNN